MLMRWWQMIWTGIAIRIGGTGKINISYG